MGQGHSPFSLPPCDSFSPALEWRSEQASLLLREAGLEHRHEDRWPAVEGGRPISLPGALGKLLHLSGP